MKVGSNIAKSRRARWNRVWATHGGGNTDLDVESWNNRRNLC